jgi:ABC-type uncharacterized transport system ATPase subunit
VQGNGQTELVEVLTGLRRAESGAVTIHGEDLTNASPRAVTGAGSGHVPENRHRFGMVDAYTVSENLVLNFYYAPPYAAQPSLRALPWVIVRYGVIALAIFAVLALLWGQLWDRVLWPLILDLYGITDVGAAGREETGGPLLVGLLVMVVMAVIFAYVAHRLTLWLIHGMQGRFASPAQRGAVDGGLMLDHQAVDRYAEKLVDEFDIRTPRIETSNGSRPNVQISGSSLSGGNQQKMVVAREFGRRPRLLIAAQPTRGIDVGSIEFIHQQIVAQRDAEAAVLLVSAELDEITALSDRIAVMFKGEVVATVDANSVTREQLGLLMAGAHAGDVLNKPSPAPAAA